MDNKTYTITLADGTVIDDLRMNGDNYISNTSLTKESFECNLSPVVISDGENEETHDAMKLVHLTNMNGSIWFALNDLSKEELIRIKNRSDIDYLALMCDVEL